MGRYSKGPLDSDTDMDDEVVKDKLPPLSTLGEIKIKGRAKEEEAKKTIQTNTFKQDFRMYLHVKKRIDSHLKAKKVKLITIIYQIKVDLTIIRRKYGDVHSYSSCPTSKE